MDFFDYIKEKLFGQSSQSKPASEPVVHEIIKRSERERKSFESWLESHELKGMLHFIRNQYALGKSGSEDQAMIRLLDASPSFGFMLRYPENMKAANFKHLFDYFKDRLKSLGYKVYVSDRKIHDRGENVEITERHHLKAGKNLKNFGKKPLEQLYGNVTIELLLSNDRPQQIKFLCNAYKDRSFSEAKNFDELIELLTEEL
jgi:hypothetical protein